MVNEVCEFYLSGKVAPPLVLFSASLQIELNRGVVRLTLLVISSSF